MDCGMRGIRETGIMFFSCRECKYNIGYPDSIGATVICQHPAVEKLKFSTTIYGKLNKVDLKKIKHLINDILKLKYEVLPGIEIYFNFPFEYNPILIVGCEGFDK